MNFSQEAQDSQVNVLTVQITPEDYQEKIDKTLKDISKKATMKGFRPGMVPKSLVKKMHGRQVLVDTINELLNEELPKYLRESEMKYIAFPVPIPSEDLVFDLDNKEPMVFRYEVAMEPDFSVPFADGGVDLPIKSYQIISSDADIEREIMQMRRSLGEVENPEEDLKEGDAMEIMLVELEESGDIKEGGIMSFTWVATDMYDDETMERVISLKMGEEIVIDDVYTSFKRTPEEVNKHILGLDDEADTSNISPKFKLKIQKVQRLKLAELDQELFDKVMGPGKVTSEDEFRGMIKADVATIHGSWTTNKLVDDVYTYAMDNVEVEFPEEILKKYLFHMYGQEAAANIDALYSDYTRNLKWTLTRNRILRANDYKLQVIEQDEHDHDHDHEGDHDHDHGPRVNVEVIDFAFKLTEMEIRRKGQKIADENIFREFIENKLLEDNKYRTQIVEGLLNEKAAQYVLKANSIENEELGVDAFVQMRQADQMKSAEAQVGELVQESVAAEEEE